MPALSFQVLTASDRCHARAGRIRTAHGDIDTPAFAPVGTLGAVKGLLPEQVNQLGGQFILANTYHLMLRPGSDLVAQMGGLHRWMRWHKPILTDSGGFQVFSLGHINRITDDGVTFKSHVDGTLVHLTPERSIKIQNELGADMIMAFDDCPPAAIGRHNVCSAGHTTPINQHQTYRLDEREHAQRCLDACRRTVAWLQRSVAAHQRPEDQALFGIVQGGTDLELRSWCVAQMTQYDLPGYAIGGVAVGEDYEGLRTVVEHTAPLLPTDKPRYLMGVGYQRDILTAVRAGIDLFDCVLPTRNGRNGNAFTPTGQIRIKNAKYTRDQEVIEPGCDCPACLGGFSRSYLRHLFMGREMLGPILLTIHNIRHFQRYLLDIRRAITHNDWSLISRDWPVAIQNPGMG